MIKVEIRQGESIDKALKRFKRRFAEVGVIKEFRERKQFTKPSVKKRKQKLKATYIQKLRSQEDI